MVVALWPEAESLVVAGQPSAPSIPRPLVKARIAVLNGCGEDQVAGRLTQRLRSLGFDVIHEGNAASFDFLHTLVLDRGGDLDKACNVAASLGIPRCIQQISADEFRLEDVAIVIGRDHQRLRLLED